MSTNLGALNVRGQHGMKSGISRRFTSSAGLILMIFGLTIVSWELSTGMFNRRFGVLGFVAIIALGIASSVWGLKEVVAHFWPKLAGRGYYFRLPREGVFFLIMTFFFFGGSILSHSNTLMMVFCLMVGAFLINGWFTYTMLQGARVLRKLPDRSMSGEQIDVVIELENRLPWLSARLMTVHDTCTFEKSSAEPEIVFVQVPPKSSCNGEYQFEPSARGKYEFSNVDVTTRFPLGLVQRGVSLENLQTIYIYPRIGHLQSGWRRTRPSSAELSSQIRGSAGAFQDEFHQLREYRVGDDRRMIHWRTSARLNELMVSEYQEVRDRDLLLIVDASLSPNAPESALEDLECGLRFATTISMDVLNSNRHSSLFVELLGERHFSWLGDLERTPDTLLDEFAMLRPSQGDSSRLLKELLRDDRNRSRRIVVISTRPDTVLEIVQNWQDSTPPDVEVFGMSRADLGHVFSDDV